MVMRCDKAQPLSNQPTKKMDTKDESGVVVTTAADDNDKAAADIGGCRCSWRPILLFNVLIVLALLYLWIVKQPTAFEAEKLFVFVTVEVRNVLFIAHTPVFIPLILLSLCPIAVWYVPFVPLCVLGWLNGIRFYYYYFISGPNQFPAIVALVTRVLELIPEGVVRTRLAYFFPVCPTAGGCSILVDSKANLMIGLWFDDALWLGFIMATHFVLDGVRYRQSFSRIGVWILAAAVLGWDTAAPVWFIWLHSREQIFATYDEPKVEFGHKNGVGVYCYAALALGSVAKWLVPLMDWAVTRGTVAGQQADGLVNPFASRATLLIYGNFFVWTIVWLAQVRITQFRSSVVNFVVTNVIRVLLLWLCTFVLSLFLFLAPPHTPPQLPSDLLCCWFASLHDVVMGHVAGAAASVLLFREFTPNATYVGRGIKAKPKTE